MILKNIIHRFILIWYNFDLEPNTIYRDFKELEIKLFLIDLYVHIQLKVAFIKKYHIK